MDSIIFDVDGTMWDTTHIVAKAWTESIFKETNETRIITADYLKTQFGKLLSEIADNIFPNESEEQRAFLIERCCEREHNALIQAPPSPYSGMTEALQVLSQKYKLFLVSNCQAGYIELFLDATNYHDYFVDHLCPGDTGNAKAANIKAIIKKHNLQSPVYVGDTQGDCNATREAGIPFIYASYGFGDVVDYDYQIAAPLDLLNLTNTLL